MTLEAESLESPTGETPQTGKSVVLFDGVCNLCNSAVNFLLDIDQHQRLHFASLQSTFGQAVLAGQGMDQRDLDTFVFLVNNQVFTRSRAALEVLRAVGGVWQLAYCLIIVPPFIRDGIYKWVAKNRYRWFGKQETCRLPTPLLKARFL